MDAILQKLGEMIADNFTLGLAIAFVAGILTVFTPCSLTSIPLIVAYVGGSGKKNKLVPEETNNELFDNESNDETLISEDEIVYAGEESEDQYELKEDSAELIISGKKALIYTLFICLGQTVVFVTLGLIAASLGRLMGIGGFGKIWDTILIALMVWMALETFGVTNVLSRSTGAVSKVTQKGIFGALLVGMAGALFATPCSTPVLTAMLAYVSTAGWGILAGGLLLLSYSLGHSILLVIAGTSLGFVEAMTGEGKLSRISKAVKIILGVLMLLLALYFVYTTFFA
jgi:cytochrome c biogenesis protein CcdA